MMFDATADADKMHARILGRLAIYPAVAHVHGSRRVHTRALQAQAQDVGRWLGANLVECTGDRVEYTAKTKMLDQRRHRRRSIGRQPELVAPLELEHERAQLNLWPQYLEKRRLIHVAGQIVHPAKLGRVATRERRKHLARGERNRRDFLVTVQWWFTDPRENPVVVGNVRFFRIEQHAVRVEHHQFNHVERILCADAARGARRPSAREWQSAHGALAIGTLGPPRVRRRRPAWNRHDFARREMLPAMRTDHIRRHPRAAGAMY